MSKITENYWVSAEEYLQEEEFVNSTKEEFYNLPILNQVAAEESEISENKHNRRDFLKYLGFSIGAATIAASCETPLRKAVPYVTKPDSIVPGVANYYASTFVKGNDVVPIVVKTREGRPIKIEGNTLSQSFGGGTSARAQASVLDLYDIGRLKSAGKVSSAGKFGKMSWSELDKAVLSGLNANSRICIVTHSNSSPSRRKVLNQFIAAYPNSKVVVYDPISSSAILLANERSFGKRIFPGYIFEQAQVIVNFGADFLGTWVSPVEYAAGWVKNRKVTDHKNPSMSKLIQYEANMSYTGSNADNRVLIKPSEQGLAIAKLYNAVAALTGGTSIAASGTLSNPKADKSFSATAKELVNASKSGKGTLVLSNSNNTAEQMIINKINSLLGNYGKTIDLNNYSFQRQGIDKDTLDLVKEMESGSVDALILLDDANPVFELPEGAAFKAAMGKVKLKIGTALSNNESNALCDYSAPTHHFLESWGDAQPKVGTISLIQPTIQPLFNTRQVEESLLIWAKVNAPGTSNFYNDYIKGVWNGEVFNRQSDFSAFSTFWDNALHDGVREFTGAIAGGTMSVDVSSLAASISKPSASNLEAVIYEPIGVGFGVYANNPWLQEMPDPITRSVWNSVVHIPLKWNGDNDFEYYKDLSEDGLYVDVKESKNTIKDMPIVRQFGQMANTIALPLGYGRSVGNASAKNVGSDIFPLLTRDGEGNIQYRLNTVEITPTGGKDKFFASVQHHHTLGVKGKDKSNKVINVDEKAVMTIGNGYQGGLVDRSILRSSDLSNIAHSLELLAEERKEAAHLNNETLYPGHDDLYKQGHHWGLSIDLTACTGCAACQVACVSENNVPIVGKEEVKRHHEMTWLRIDRYYYGDVESPNVFYQPMMCQHCDNAPCENVCPVNATNHSAEGLNQMAYNRCVGTRYCANNCPYKVRRFNWADYTSADLFAWNESNAMPDGSLFYEDNVVRMVLNPDVTVRSRGVIEKCSLCVQRLQESKLKAKIEQRPLRESDLSTACVTACPTGAIKIGDQNIKDGTLNKHWSEPTTYFVLEEINTRSKIGYKMKLTNKVKELSGYELNS